MIAALIAYLVDAAWQVPVLLAGAFALSRFGGLSPRGRNRVWLVCLACAVALPAVHFQPLTSASSQTASVASAAMVQAIAVAPPTAQALPRPFELDLDARWALVIVAAFALVVLAGLARVLSGWLAVGRLARRAVVTALPAGVAAELEAVAAVHRAHAPELRETPETSSPVVAGVVRPLILAPDGFVARPEPEVRAALMHELAHVLRRDYAVNLLCELASLPICWHPAAYLIKAEIRRTRELACDAMASAAMRSERAYAESLVALARSCNSPAHGASPAFVGLFGNPSLEERLMHLIGPKRTPRPAMKTLGLLSGAAVAAGAVGAAVLLHVPTALAQSAPPAPPPAPGIYSTPEAPPAPPAYAPRAPEATPAVPAELATPPEPPVAPEPPTAPATPADPAVTPTPPTPPEADAVIDEGKGGYEHRWVSRAGKHVTIVTDDPRDPTPEERERYEAKIADAMAQARKATDLVSSPAFKAKLAAIKSQDFELKAKLAALKALDAPEVKAQIAAAARMANSDTVMRAKMEALKVMDDPKIKAEIAEAERVGKSDEFRLKAKMEALKALDDPKIKAEIERAQRLSQSEDFKKAEKDLKAAAKHLRDVEKSKSH